MAKDQLKELLEATGKVLLENAWRGVAAFSSDGSCLWANELAAAVVGVPLAQLVLHPLDDALWGEGSEADARQATTANGRVRRELKLSRPDGEVRWIERTLVGVDFRGKKIPVMVFEDLTDTKRTQESLKRAELAIAQASEMIYWLREDSRFVYANDEICALLGYTRDELMTMSLCDVSLCAPGAWEEQWEATKTAGSSRQITTFRAKSGDTVEVETKASFIGVAESEGDYLCVFGRDVTEQKRLEDSLRFTQISMDSSLDHVYWVNKLGYITWVSEGHAQAAGLHP